MTNDQLKKNVVFEYQKFSNAVLVKRQKKKEEKYCPGDTLWLVTYLNKYWIRACMGQGLR